MWLWVLVWPATPFSFFCFIMLRFMKQERGISKGLAGQTNTFHGPFTVHIIMEQNSVIFTCTQLHTYIYPITSATQYAASVAVVPST